MGIASAGRMAYHASMRKRRGPACPWGAGVVALSLAAAGFVSADPVHNGNELALNFSQGNAAAKQALQKERTGLLHTFRYLEVREIAPAADGKPPVIVTVEPSSDMKVELDVDGKLSLEWARTVATGECVAAKGRIKSLGTDAPDRIVIAPAVIMHKDRADPKAGKELLNEIDKRAH